MISGPTTDIANKSLDFTVTGMGWNRSKRNQIVICYLKHGILLVFSQIDLDLSKFLIPTCRSWDVKTGQTVSFIPISHMLSNFEVSHIEICLIKLGTGP